MAVWHTKQSARAQWRDAPADEALQDLLDAAQFECETYAPAQPTPVDPDAPISIPIGWRIAHLLQARAMWTFLQTTAQQEGPSIEGVGTARVYPMDANVRARLRPNTGREQVG